MRSKTIIYLLACSALLVGCASPPAPYKLPSNKPFANVRSKIPGLNGRHESVDVYVYSGECKSRQKAIVFAIDRKATEEPTDYLKIAAGEPLIFNYYETLNGGRFCEISFEVILEQGKNYSLINGSGFIKGPIPFFTGTSLCKFGIMDDQESHLIPQKKTPCPP